MCRRNRGQQRSLIVVEVMRWEARERREGLQTVIVLNFLIIDYFIN